MGELSLKLDREDRSIEAPAGQYDTSKGLRILQRLVQNDISSKAAAEEILALLPQFSDAARSGRSERREFSYFLFTIAQQIPYTHPAQAQLADLVHCISQSPKVSYFTKLQDGTDYFDTMIELQVMMADDPGFIPCEFEPEWEETLEEQRSMALNCGAFMALVIQNTLTEHDEHTMAVMRECLEWRKSGASDSIDSFGLLHEDAFLSLGALWIINAGQSTYHTMVASPATEVRMKESRYIIAGLDPYYKGPTLGIQRWTFWKKELANAAQQEHRSEECRYLCGQAADLMEAIEKSKNLKSFPLTPVPSGGSGGTGSCVLQ